MGEFCYVQFCYFTFDCAKSKVTSNSAGAVIKLPRHVYSRNSEASVSNDGKIPGFCFCWFSFFSSVIKFDNKCAN